MVFIEQLLVAAGVIVAWIIFCVIVASAVYFALSAGKKSS